MRVLLPLLAALFVFGCSSSPAAVGGGAQPPPTAFGPSDPTEAADFLVDFRMVKVGASVSWPIRLRNPGSEEVAVRVEGIAPPFGVTGGSVVPAGGALELQFRFTPEVEGLQESTVRIVTEAAAWTVRLVGMGYSDPRCVPTFAQQSIDFGRVTTHGFGLARLEISNAGDAPCSITAAFAPSHIFSIGEGSGSLEVWPGHTETLVLRADPTEPGRTGGELTLYDNTGARHRIPLQVEEVDTCVTLSGDTDFGEVIPDCQSGTRVLTLTNDCGGEMMLVDVSVEDPADFALRTRPRSGWIAPGASVPFEVSYRPRSTDAAREATLRVIADRESPRVQLTGRPGGWPTQEDRFDQPVRPKVDSLFLIDDSPAMASFLPQLRAWIHEAGDLLELSGVNERAAVTTTSLAASEDCPGSGADGRALPLDASRPRILDGDTMDLGAALEANLPTGFCSTAPNQGLDAAVRAVTELANAADDPAHGEANDGNLGFRREDAHLQLIFVTAGDDASAADPLQLQTLAGVDPRQMQLFSAHALYASSDCAFDPRGTRYAAAVGAANGRLAVGCSQPWPSLLPGSIASESVRSRFWLTNEPMDRDGDGQITEAAGEITVLVDGVVVPEFATGGERQWAYDPEANALAFTPDHRPPEGASIVVRYETAFCA